MTGAGGRRPAPARPREAGLFFSSMAIAVALVVASCSRGERPRNLLLVTLDTTRFDRLSCYGSTSVRTPALDSIAARGVRFEQAFATAPLTLPAHASILTGLYPLEHRIRDNSGYRLVPSYETLAEVLRASGVETAAFVSSIVLKSDYGLDQGFETYDDDVKRIARSGPHAAPESQRRGEETTTLATEWLRSRGDPSRPFFLWVHYYDPHVPYEPPDEFLRSVGVSTSPTYDGEIAYVDSCVGKLLGEIGALGLSEQTVVAAIADHGESLGEHGEPTHGFFLYDATMRVPFLLAAPGALPEGAVVRDGVASAVDLMPTVLEILGARVPARVQGRSLLAAARQSRPAGAEAVMETFTPAVSFGWSRLRAIRTPTRKAVDAPRPELFDLSSDRGETRDLSATDPGSLEALLARLHDLERDLGPRASEDEESPDKAASRDDIDALRAIGYVGARQLPSSTGVDGAPAGAADPKDRVGAYVQVSHAIDLMVVHEDAEAAEILKRIVDDENDNAVLQILLGRAAMAAEQIDLAADAFEAATRLDPGSLDAPLALGYLEMKRADWSAAVKWLQMGLDRFAKAGTQHLSRALDDARVALGTALLNLDLKRRADADRVFGLVLKNSPDDPELLFRIGFAYASHQQWDAALSPLQNAVRLRPAHVPSRANCGLALTKLGRPTEAVPLLVDGLRTAPEDPRLLKNLALAYEAAGDGGKAKEISDRVSEIEARSK